ncbi:MAG: peptidoglycan DD-metalloendopeptidase family protein [Bacteroidales bacterium]|nr:peptidoglycan DD-metalloendopeptidase family protein [Bacteroidales bacterium]
MGEEKKSKLRQKLRLAIIVDKSFEELFSIRFTLVRLFFVFAAFSIMLIAGVTVLIAFTGLREYIPGYPTGEERHMIMNNLQRVDSLALEVKLRDAVLRDMRNAISGELPLEAFKQDSLRTEAIKKHRILTTEISEADSLFRMQVEAEDMFNVDDKTASTDTRLEMMFFFPPMKGIISNKFGDKEEHFGVDILAAEGTRVSSILDGTVVFSEWTVETGYVIEVQHDNQIVSLYKHNGKLLKKAGQRVTAGEAIAIVGNSGELTTGTHLHFELWYSGVPLNPENYISFE